MAKQRMVNTRYWNDGYISNLDPIEKLLFLYLLTNEHTSICGIYEVPLKHIALDTGIDKEMVDKILKRFAAENKIFYIEGWICIKNFLRHQNQRSPQVVKGIQAEIDIIPSHIIKKAIGYGYGIDTLSYLNLNLNLNSNSNPNAQSGKPLIAKVIDRVVEEIAFEEFWKLYPNKKNKKKAEDKWKRLAYAVQRQILDDLPRRAQSAEWKKDAGRYVPHPTTYLNGERWNDSIGEATQKKVHDFSSSDSKK